MASAGNKGGKDKSFHGLLVGLGIAGTIAGVAILFAYAASVHSYPQGSASDSIVQNVGQPATAMPEQSIDANQLAGNLAVADQSDVAGDSSLQTPAVKKPSDSLAEAIQKQEKSTQTSENSMPEEQQLPKDPLIVTSAAEQATSIQSKADANTTTILNEAEDINADARAQTNHIATTPKNEKETINDSGAADPNGKQNSGEVKSVDRAKQEDRPGVIVSIGTKIDDALPPIQLAQGEDDPAESDNEKHHGHKVKAQENDNKKSNDKHDKEHVDKLVKKDKHGHDNEKQSKDHKDKEKNHRKGHD
jgi:hypothetical protein